jgi:hypothetical protein
VSATCKALTIFDHPNTKIARLNPNAVHFSISSMNQVYTIKHTGKIQVVVFGVVTPCSDVVGYQRFGGPCCVHLQGEVSGLQVTLQMTATQPVRPAWRPAPCGAYDRILNL